MLQSFKHLRLNKRSFDRLDKRAKTTSVRIFGYSPRAAIFLLTLHGY